MLAGTFRYLYLIELKALFEKIIFGLNMLPIWKFEFFL